MCSCPSPSSRALIGERVRDKIAASKRKGMWVGGPVPAAKEVGIKYDIDIWARVFAPKDVSKEVVDKLAATLDKALDDPAVAKRLADLGASIPAKKERNPAEFDRFVRAEIARLSPILKAASANPN